MNGARRLPSKKSLKNLRPPWKPGQSGNPRGRPKQRKLEDTILELLSKPIDPSNKDSGTAHDLLASEIVKRCFQGKDSTLMREVLKRLWPEVSKVELDASVQNSVTIEAPRVAPTIPGDPTRLEKVADVLREARVLDGDEPDALH